MTRNVMQVQFMGGRGRWDPALYNKITYFKQITFQFKILLVRHSVGTREKILLPSVFRIHILRIRIRIQIFC
jgi:hypothetical protein